MPAIETFVKNVGLCDPLPSLRTELSGHRAVSDYRFALSSFFVHSFGQTFQSVWMIETTFLSEIFDTYIQFSVERPQIVIYII